MPEPATGVTLAKLFEYAWAGVLAVGGIVVKIVYRKFDHLQKQIEMKADKDVVDQHRDSIVKLFDVMREHESEDRSRHEQLLRHISDQHQKIFEKLSK